MHNVLSLIKYKTKLTLIIIIFILLSIPVTIYLSQTPQDIRKKASTTPLDITLSQIIPQIPGSTFTLNIIIELNPLSGIQNQAIYTSGVELTYDNNILEINNINCGNELPNIIRNGIDSINGKIFLTCSKQGGSLPLQITQSQNIILGTITAKIKNSIPNSTNSTSISFTTAIAPDIQTPQNNLAVFPQALTIPIYTITPTPTPINIPTSNLSPTPSPCPNPPSPILRLPADNSSFPISSIINLSVNPIENRCGVNSAEHQITFYFNNNVWSNLWGVEAWNTGPYNVCGIAKWSSRSRYFDSNYNTYRISENSPEKTYFITCPPTPTTISPTATTIPQPTNTIIPSRTPTPTITLCPTCTSQNVGLPVLKTGSTNLYNINLSWNDVANEEGYLIQKNNNNFITTGADTISFTDTNNSSGFTCGSGIINYNIIPVKQGCTNPSCQSFSVIIPPCITPTPTNPPVVGSPYFSETTGTAERTIYTYYCSSWYNGCYQTIPTISSNMQVNAIALDLKWYAKNTVSIQLFEVATSGNKAISPILSSQVTGSSRGWTNYSINPPVQLCTGKKYAIYVKKGSSNNLTWITKSGDTTTTARNYKVWANFGGNCNTNPTPTLTKTPASITPTKSINSPTPTPIRINPTPTTIPTPTPNNLGNPNISDYRGTSWINLNSIYGNDCSYAHKTIISLPATTIRRIETYLKWTAGGGNIYFVIQKEGTTIRLIEKFVGLPVIAGEGWIPLDISSAPVSLLSGQYGLYLKKSGTATVQWISGYPTGITTCNQIIRNYRIWY